MTGGIGLMVLFLAAGQMPGQGATIVERAAQSPNAVYSAPHPSQSVVTGPPGNYDTSGQTTAGSPDSGVRFPFDDVQPWVHGHFQEMPAYGGYHFFRPYNYKHVFPQSQVAAGWRMPPNMPYSQAYFFLFTAEAQQSPAATGVGSIFNVPRTTVMPTMDYLPPPTGAKLQSPVFGNGAAPSATIAPPGTSYNQVLQAQFAQPQGIAPQTLPPVLPPALPRR